MLAGGKETSFKVSSFHQYMYQRDAHGDNARGWVRAARSQQPQLMQSAVSFQITVLAPWLTFHMFTQIYRKTGMTTLDQSALPQSSLRIEDEKSLLAFFQE
jgi:hypothetical protein